MKKISFFGLVFLLAAAVWGTHVWAESIYSHQQISGEMFEPTIWANEKLNVLWSEGPDYETLTLYGDGSTLQLTDRLRKFSNPVMNEPGLVAWVESDSQVYLFDGEKTVRLSDGTIAAWNVDMNKRGQVVWDGDDASGRNIYFFNGKETEQLTHSGVNGVPKISDRGDIVWIHSDGVGDDFEIITYDGHRISQLTFNDIADENPRISPRGHIVWLAWDGQKSDVYYYDRHNVLQLTDSEFYAIWPTLTPKGQPFWLEWDGSDWEISTFTKGALWQVTDNDYEDYLPQANKKGQFVWEGWAGSTWPWEIFFFDRHEVLRLTDNETFDRHPVLNNHGHIAWTHHTGNYIQSGELHLYDGSSTQALTADNPSDISDRPRLLTDRGDLVYTRARAVGSPGAQDFFVTVFLALKSKHLSRQERKNRQDQ